jgi:hypothetical protein
MILEVSNVPDSRDGESGSSIQSKAAPVPSQLKGIENVVEDTEGYEGFILMIIRNSYRKCKDT